MDATLAADIISTVEFDHTGDYLATGDKGGRVVLFERNESVRREDRERKLRTLLMFAAPPSEKGVRVQVSHGISEP